MTEIFKVQRAIFGSDAILIYNESRSITEQIPNTHELDELFGDDFKIYVKGSFTEDGRFKIVKRVGSQDW